MNNVLQDVWSAIKDILTELITLHQLHAIAVKINIYFLRDNACKTAQLATTQILIELTALNARMVVSHAQKKISVMFVLIHQGLMASLIL